MGKPANNIQNGKERVYIYITNKRKYRNIYSN